MAQEEKQQLRLKSFEVLLSYLDIKNRNLQQSQHLYIDDTSFLVEAEVQEVIPENPLIRPAVYPLFELFRQLKFGRPSASQIYLDKCIEGLKSGDGYIANQPFKQWKGLSYFLIWSLRDFIRKQLLSQLG